VNLPTVTVHPTQTCVACERGTPPVHEPLWHAHDTGYLPTVEMPAGTYALVPVADGATVEAEWYWICEYPEFNDAACQSHYCEANGLHPSGGECCDPAKARMPWKHEECGRVLLVRGAAE
jgi:hypothetical protein